MAYLESKNVPRESYIHRVGRWVLRFAKIVRVMRKPSDGQRRKNIPSDRMVVLNPHLLRDIGFTDTNVPRKHN